VEDIDGGERLIGLECRDCSGGSAVSIPMVWGVLWAVEIIFAARKKGGGNDDWIIDDGAAFAWYASPRRGLTGRALRYWLICFPCNKSRGRRPARWLGYRYYLFHLLYRLKGALSAPSSISPMGSQCYAATKESPKRRREREPGWSGSMKTIATLALLSLEMHFTMSQQSQQ